MKALLLVAHGSRRRESNEYILSISQQISQLGSIQLSGCGFLEIAKPDILQAAGSLLDQGATEILVLPYFLAPGNHVVHDIPAVIDKLKIENPRIDFQILSFLGSNQLIPELISTIVQRQLIDQP